MKKISKKKKIAIIGTNGLPANYGGFETLAENLAKFQMKMELNSTMYVFCSSYNYKIKNNKFLNSHLIYIPIAANGFSSIIYDGISLIYSVMIKCDSILMLGYSGSIFLPFIKLLTNTQIIINVDGIEWDRSKWSFFAKNYLKLSEYLSVKCADVIVVDNLGLESYFKKKYDITCKVIAYGGDHATKINKKTIRDINLPKHYALAIARIEPENNIDMIIEAFSEIQSIPIIIIGNFSTTSHGQFIKQKYSNRKNINILDPIYDLGILKTIRSGADIYIHGHSAGGTNPSLVEMMYFGTPIFAYDCIYNRFTTNNEAMYFKSTNDLIKLLIDYNSEVIKISGRKMQKFAENEYNWNKIGEKYFEIILGNFHN